MRRSLTSADFAAAHRARPADFTRQRTLGFGVVCAVILSTGMKSLQLSLNTLLPKFRLSSLTVSGMAYSKARRKLKHTAFIALNQGAVVEPMYADGPGTYRTLHGLRILAVDSSTVTLPPSNDVITAFGSAPYASRRRDGSEVRGTRVYGRASVLYDVLNRVALDAVLEPYARFEGDLAIGQLAHVTATDLVVYDRGYGYYKMVAAATMANGHFLIRCPRRRFTVADAMLKGEGPDDVVTAITPPAPGFADDLANATLPLQVTVRFIRVRLKTGEYEVLVTSLLDARQYPLDIFRELYYLRWGIETFYGVLKTRLVLENFSGLSAEAVRQDFHAAVLLTGLESIFTEEAEASLAKQPGGHAKKVNKAVSFNALKERVFALFYSGRPADAVLDELTVLFTTSPVLVRPEKKPPRKNTLDKQKLSFYRLRRKGVF